LIIGQDVLQMAGVGLLNRLLESLFECGPQTLPLSAQQRLSWLRLHSLRVTFPPATPHESMQ
jgi:hypothetical protein